MNKIEVDVSTGVVSTVPLSQIELDAIVVTPLSQYRAAKIAQLQASRDAACVAAVVVNGKTFDAAPNVQTGIKRLADRMRRNKPTTLQALLDTSGNPVSPVTQALLDGIEDAIAANTEAAWNHYGSLVAQVNAATDAATVNAVVW